MIASLVALGAGLGMVMVAELGWHRAINTAKSVGLVSPETDA